MTPKTRNGLKFLCKQHCPLFHYFVKLRNMTTPHTYPERVADADCGFHNCVPKSCPFLLLVQVVFLKDKSVKNLIGNLEINIFKVQANIIKHTINIYYQKIILPSVFVIRNN